MTDDLDIILMDDMMGNNFLRYATAVNLHRSIPEARDGLKPVQRRILFAMQRLGLHAGGEYAKTARIVGDTMGQLHPHGDVSIGDAVNKMVQWWNLRYPLIDGYGNFGSPNVEEDPAAAARYTEVRLTAIGELMMGGDLHPDVITYMPTYDDKSEEPSVLPSLFPNAICNGQSGIGVAMSSDMVPHNLTEVGRAIKLLAKDPDATVKQLLRAMPGPDFPTGGFILGTEGIEDYYTTGKGSIVLQGKVEVVPENAGEASIIVTQLPYGVQPNRFIKECVALCESKKLEGISNINDAHGKGTEPIRIVLELKRGVDPAVVLNHLYKHTSLRLSTSVNQTVIVNGVPQLVSMPQLVLQHIEHRIAVIVARHRAELKKNEERAHLLEGLIRCLADVDTVIAIVRGSQDAAEARDKLMKKFKLDEVQANHVLDLALRRLAKLAVGEIRDEYKALQARAKEIKSILASRDRQVEILCGEVDDMVKRHGDERLTTIRTEKASEISLTDLLEQEEVVVTITNDGLCKRVPLSDYRTQRRGGKGTATLSEKEENEVELLFVANTHDELIVFTNGGNYHRIRVHEIQRSTRTGKGTNVHKLMGIPEDQIVAAAVVDRGGDSGYVVTCTARGLVKRTALSEYRTKRSDGVAAVKLNDGDELYWATLTDGSSDLLLATSAGFVVRFAEDDIRPQGRVALGVAGIRLASTDEMVAFAAVDPKSDLDVFAISERAMAKRSKLSEYRATRRNAKGIKTMSIGDKTGPLVQLAAVHQDDKLIISTARGRVIRIEAKSVKRQGRITQGVRAFAIDADDSVRGLTPVRQQLD